MFEKKTAADMSVAAVFYLFGAYLSFLSALQKVLVFA